MASDKMKQYVQEVMKVMLSQVEGEDHEFLSNVLTELDFVNVAAKVLADNFTFEEFEEAYTATLREVGEVELVELQTKYGDKFANVSDAIEGLLMNHLISKVDNIEETPKGE